MPERMKRSITNWLSISSQVIVVTSAIYFFSFLTADPDLWGHIKFGEELWHSQKIIHSDIYSFTALGNPWINHEWLAELIFYAVYSLGGDFGLLSGKLLLGLMIIGTLNKICSLRAQTPIIYMLFIVLAVFIISPGFMIRPQLFSFLFFILFLYLLHLFFSTKKNRLYLLPILMILWVNLHGGFLMGLVLLLTVTSYQIAARFISQQEQEYRLKTLVCYFLLTTLATLINPYGYNLLLFLYDSLSFPRSISEWRPVYLWDFSFLRFKIMVVVFLIVLLKTLLSKKFNKRSTWEVAAILLTLYAALRHQRHTPFFAMTTAPYLVHRLSIWSHVAQKKHPKLKISKITQNSIALLIILLASYQLIDGIHRYTSSQCRILVNPFEYPVSAVQFIARNNIKGNIILPFNWGEYAIWKLYPDCKVSIDGRFRTVYSEKVIQDHFIADNDFGGWLALISTYQADILLMRQIPFFQELIKENEKWVYVYSDKTAIIFLKKNRYNQEMLARFKRGLLEYPHAAPSVFFP